MSVEKGLHTVSFPAGADLSAKQFFLLELASDGEVTGSNATTDKIVGVLQNKPAAAARAANVAIGGITKVAMTSTAASSAITRGDQLVSSASGRAAKFNGTSANAYIIGQALTTTTTGTAAGTGNQIGSMLLTYEGFGSTV